MRVFAKRRMAAILVLGFSSGLPLALTGQALQSWLTADGVDLRTIGTLALVGMPYTYKFLWAPLMDRYEPPGLGRRRGWFLVCQLALAALMFAMAAVPPALHVTAFAALAVGLAFASASLDIVVDAYRVDVSTDEERGAAASIGVLGYRLAMLTSGGLAFVAAEVVGWATTCAGLGGLMLGLAALTQVVAPRVASDLAPWTAATPAWRHLAGFVAMVAGAALGATVARGGLEAVGRALELPAFTAGSTDPWIGLGFTMAQIAAAVPLAFAGARLTRFELLMDPLRAYFSRDHAWAFLALIVLYKLGDAFAGVLSVTFLQQGLGCSLAEIGIVNKVVGMVATVVGGLAGGVAMVWLGLRRSLLLFGALQIASNAGYWLLAEVGRGALGLVTLPLPEAALRVFLAGKGAQGWDGSLDLLLGLALTVENLAGGMGSAALVALLMALCPRGGATATQYALLSALAAVGRVYVGPTSGFLVEELGWSGFFQVSMIAGLPGFALLIGWGKQLDALDRPDLRR